jgi:hypothetical protein
MYKSLILALAALAAATPIPSGTPVSGTDDTSKALPNVNDLLAGVDNLLPNTEDLPTQDLPRVQDLLLEIDSLLPSAGELPSATKTVRNRGLIKDVESDGVDILDSQDIIPLENTLSEFDTSKSSPSPSKSSAWPSASAWPSSSAKPAGSKEKGTDYLATFDDLTPAVGEVAVQELGPYDGLDYNGIDLVTLGVEGTIIAGIIPKSSPNAGAYGLTTGLLDGAPNITTKYEGTVTDTFDFHNFWFGCVKGTVESVSFVELRLGYISC